MSRTLWHLATLLGFFLMGRTVDLGSAEVPSWQCWIFAGATGAALGAAVRTAPLPFSSWSRAAAAALLGGVLAAVAGPARSSLGSGGTAGGLGGLMAYLAFAPESLLRAARRPTVDP